MSPLTKAFVILVTVLSLLLVALVVPFVARTQDYNARIQGLETRLAAAEQTARARQSDYQAALQQMADQAAGFNRERETFTTQITQSQSDLGRIQGELAAERARLTDLQVSLARLTAAAEQDAQLVSTLRQDLNAARQELATTGGRNIELSDEVVRLQSELQAAERGLRRSQEQYASAQEELQRYLAVIEQTPGARDALAAGRGQAPAPQAPPVQGAVTAVTGPSGGEQFVQVDLGASDAIQPGMRLIVARGNDYVGTLVVEQVDADAAAGRMTLQEQPVQQGDRVYGSQG